MIMIVIIYIYLGIVIIYIYIIYILTTPQKQVFRTWRNVGFSSVGPCQHGTRSRQKTRLPFSGAFFDCGILDKDRSVKTVTVDVTRILELDPSV